MDGGFLASDGIARTRQAQANSELQQVDITGLRLGEPIARPHAVWCIGMNYPARAAESGSAPPEGPVLFFKVPNTVEGTDDDVLIPRGSTKTDWEVELAVVIGRRAQ